MYDAYNTIENHPWIPKQAFLYFPSGNSTIKQQDDFKMIIRNQIKRLIYEGGIQYCAQENQKIQCFKQFIDKKGVILGKQWSKAYLYKFLQSTGYDQKKSLKQILSHNEYKKDIKSKNFQDLKKEAQIHLKKGPLYFNGRDAKYRPILVCDIAKINSMKLSQSQLFNCLQYFFEFLYRNMLIHGQVENVIGIIDVGGISPWDLIKPMKMTISFLQGNYKYKLHAMYIIQSTGMFQMAYSIAKQFMKEDTIRKVNIIEKGHAIEPLLQFANPMQLEQRFGGIHPNLKQDDYWPPQIFGDDYSHPLVHNNMVTQEQYKQLYQNGLLPQRKIYLDFIRQSQDSSQQSPILNNKPSQSNADYSSSGGIHGKKRQKNFFERTLKKLSCHGCFGDKQKHKDKKQKKKHKN